MKQPVEKFLVRALLKVFFFDVSLIIIFEQTHLLKGMTMYAVIMAGGFGKRFWPWSRSKTPKQFLKLFGDETMIQRTARRLFPIIPPEKTFVVTTKDQKSKIAQQLPELNVDNIISEPFGRDTAPCIGLAAVHISNIAEESDPIQIVLPADHLIVDEEKFRNSLLAGAEFSSKNDCITTIGIEPSRPETGYGYIQRDGSEIEFSGQSIYKVKTFAEKPNPETAKRFVQSGDFLWNSGIFIWKTSTIFNEISNSLPDLYDGLQKIKTAFGKSNQNRIITTVYRQIRPISIDYGVMEKSTNDHVIKGQFGWSDVGSWEEFYKQGEKDVDGNVIRGLSILKKSKNNLIYGDKKLIAAVGLKDLIVIDTPDILLLCNRKNSQDVKLLVDYLHKNDMKKYL